MAGPTPMTLGGHAFQALGFGYNELSRHLETSWAKLEVANRSEVQQWCGPKAETITIKGVLFPEEWGGLDTLDALRSEAWRGKVMTLATGDGRIHGRFTVQNIEDDGKHIDRRGMPRENSYTIKLERYEAGGAGASLVSALTSLFG